MTALDLIGNIFSRPQQGVASNMRWLTKAQFDYLRDLIGRDEEQAPIRNGMNGGLVWEPAGSWKYVLACQPGSRPDKDRHSLMRLPTVRTQQGATLF